MILDVWEKTGILAAAKECCGFNQSFVDLLMRDLWMWGMTPPPAMVPLMRCRVLRHHVWRVVDVLALYASPSNPCLHC